MKRLIAGKEEQGDFCVEFLGGGAITCHALTTTWQLQIRCHSNKG